MIIQKVGLPSCCVGCAIRLIFDDNLAPLFDSYGKQRYEFIHTGCCDSINNEEFVHRCAHTEDEGARMRLDAYRMRLQEIAVNGLESFEHKGEFMAWGAVCGPSGKIKGNPVDCVLDSLCSLHGKNGHDYCDRDVWEIVSLKHDEDDVMYESKVYEVQLIGLRDLHRFDSILTDYNGYVNSANISSWIDEAVGKTS